MKKITLILSILLGYLLSTVPCHAYRDLETGVFLTRDPADFVDGPNVYTYVNQNPWTKFDPDGLQSLIISSKDEAKDLRKKWLFESIRRTIVGLDSELAAKPSEEQSRAFSDGGEFSLRDEYSKAEFAEFATSARAASEAATIAVMWERHDETHKIYSDSTGRAMTTSVWRLGGHNYIASDEFAARQGEVTANFVAAFYAGEAGIGVIRAVPGLTRLMLGMGGAANSTTRVGRWMSEVEYNAMTKTNMVQQSRSGTTHVASPASPFAYQAQATPGSLYVEFDVTSSSLKATQEGWPKILSPSTLEGRLAAQKGLPVPQLPVATNIQHTATKFR